MEIDISPFKHLYPFQSHYLDLDGLKYHYIDEGKGDPVVMIHGNPTWSFYFRELIRGLSPQFRVIVPDHIGCGLSDIPDESRYDYRLKSRVNNLEALMKSLKVKEKITLVVHDWGGMIGLVFALRHLENIDRMVIMNTSGFLPPTGKRLPFRLRMVKNIKPLATVGVLGLNLFARAALLMASYKGLSKNVKAGLIAPYNCWKNRIATLRFVQDIPLNEREPSYRLVKCVDENLHKLSKIPMLICWGRHDFVFDMAYLAEWKRRFPKADIHVLPDAGHYVLEDEAQKILSLITDFLKKRPASP